MARKAGTEEMLVELAIDAGPAGGFRGRGMRGRGRFDPGEYSHMSAAADAAEDCESWLAQDFSPASVEVLQVEMALLAAGCCRKGAFKLP